MNHRNYLMIVFLAFALAAQSWPAAATDIVIPHADLGDHWCIPADDGTTRAQIREAMSLATETDWGANATHVSGGAAWKDCDASVAFKSQPSAKCMPTDAAKVLVGAPWRMSIVQSGTNTFTIALKDKSGALLTQLNSTGSFTVTAIPGNVHGTWRWLQASAVPWVISGVVTATYDIFIYLTDDPNNAGDIAQVHHVEFFDTSKTDCTNEEPTKQTLQPHSDTSDVCPDLVTAKSLRVEAPIGDGHHPRAVNGACTY